MAQIRRREVREYFKIVKREDGVWVSAFTKGKGKVVYREGEWVQAPTWLRKLGYHLLCFQTFEQAKIFLEKNKKKGLAIWKVEGEEEVSLPRSLSPYELFRGKVLENLHLFGFPPGSVNLKRVKLLIRVS